MRPESRDTAADIWLRPPAELRGFLKRWHRAVEAVAAGKTAAAVA